MKTLRKFFIMFAIVLFASFAAKSMIIAEEGPTEPDYTIIKEDADIKDGELTKDETGEPQIEEEIEVFVDTDEGADVEINEGEQGYTEIPEETPGHPTNILGEYTDTDVVDPADIEVTIDPELGQEVEDVNAEKSIEEQIKDWVWDSPVRGHYEDKTVEKKTDIKVVNNEDGTWTIITPEIEYVLHHDFKGYYWSKPIYEDNTEIIGDYEKVYIHIDMQDMQIDEEITGDDDAGLNLIKKKIDISLDLLDPDNPVSDVVTVFDADNVGLYVKEYDKAYDDPNEGIKFSNIKGRVYDSEGNLVDENVVIVKFNENTGEVTLESTITGEFKIYLEGWYTQSQYRHIDSDISYRYDKLGDVEYETHLLGKYKYTYENNVFGIVGLTKNTYKLQDNSGWATFAELDLKVVEAVAEKVQIHEEVASLTEKEIQEIIEKVKEEYGIEINENDITNVEKWIVASEADTTESEIQQGIQDIEEKFGITADDEKFSWFDINLFRQVTINDDVLPAEQIKSLTEAQTIILEVSKDKVQLEPGKQPNFKVYYKHIDKEEVIIDTIDDIEWILEGDVYKIKFKAKDFSLYGVTYELVNKPHKRAHNFVTTGIESNNPVKHNNLFTLIVMCAFATLLAIKKEH